MNLQYCNKIQYLGQYSFYGVGAERATRAHRGECQHENRDYWSTAYIHHVCYLGRPHADLGEASLQPTRATSSQARRRRPSITRYLKSTAFFWRAKVFVKRILGKEPWLRRGVKLRTTTIGDWTFVADDLDEHSVVYSFGVGDSITFDLELIRRFGLTVHAFDPTPYTLTWIKEQETPGRFVFHPWALAEVDGALRLFPRARKNGRRSEIMWTLDEAQASETGGIDVQAYSLPSITHLLSHSRVDIVKMDIEGAEYGALDAMLAMSHLPGQVLVEFHHRFPGIGKQKTLDAIARLRSAGYEIFSISRTAREVGFIRRLVP